MTITDRIGNSIAVPLIWVLEAAGWVADRWVCRFANDTDEGAA